MANTDATSCQVDHRRTVRRGARSSGTEWNPPDQGGAFGAGAVDGAGPVVLFRTGAQIIQTTAASDVPDTATVVLETSDQLGGGDTDVHACRRGVRMTAGVRQCFTHNPDKIVGDTLRDQFELTVETQRRREPKRFLSAADRVQEPTPHTARMLLPSVVVACTVCGSLVALARAAVRGCAPGRLVGRGMLRGRWDPQCGGLFVECQWSSVVGRLQWRAAEKTIGRCIIMDLDADAAIAETHPEGN